MAVHAALLDDAACFGWLEAHAARLVARDLDTMERLVQRTAALRLERFGQGGDPADAGPWAAHRLESLSADRLRHGEAVAIGLALDATYAMVTGMLAEADWRRVVGLLLALGFDLSCPELAGPSLTDGLEEFRVHRGGPLALTLPTGIGRSVMVREMDRDAIAEAVGGLARVQTAWQEGDWRWAS
jgi:3-dehydroquinate synthase